MAQETLKPVAHGEARYREIVYQAIKDAILSGEYETERPLVEETLAGILNVSRTPVREALVILEHEGMIGPRGRRGLYVRPIDRQEFGELFSASENLTAELARRAALLATDEQVQGLAESVQRAKYYAGQRDLPRFFRAGREFLRRLGAAAGNEPLAGSLLRSAERLHLFLLNEAPDEALESLAPAVRQHEALLNAVLRRDPEQAARLVISHTQWLRERWAGLFPGEAEEAPGPPDLADF